MKNFLIVFSFSWTTLWSAMSNSWKGEILLRNWMQKCNQNSVSFHVLMKYLIVLLVSFILASLLFSLQVKVIWRKRTWNSQVLLSYFDLFFFLLIVQTNKSCSAVSCTCVTLLFSMALWQKSSTQLFRCKLHLCKWLLFLSDKVNN